MKIVQVSHAITIDDAASNQIIAMDKAFNKLGRESEIYSNKIDKAFTGIVKPFSELRPDPDNILIYHFSTGTSFTQKVLDYPYPVVMYYHNITPAKYYFGNAWGSWWNCLKGRRQLSKLSTKALFAVGASEYSARELRENGFKNVEVLPILLEYEKYDTSINKVSDSPLNILFVGRVVPHKCQHDLIEIISQYKSHVSDNVMLTLVGGQKKSYTKKLRKQIATKRLTDNVVLTGKVPFDELCKYYSTCDLFLSMSEHEGFGVPLVESIIYNKPVFAYASTAVPETVGNAGVLFNDKNHVEIAKTIARVMGSEKQLSFIKEGQQERLNQLSEDKILEIIDQYLSKIEKLYQACFKRRQQ